jgi:hypothetical protein
MNITPQQRKALWIGIGIVAVFYVGRSVMDSARQAAYQQQQAIRAAQLRAEARAHATAPRVSATPAVPSSPAATHAPAPAASGLSGIWQGRTAITGRGICTLRIELHENPPEHFTGYSSLACANFAPLMSEQDRNPKSATLNRMSPASAVLSGAMENSSIRFHVDKTIGTNSNGCAATSFTLTPFGANQLAAEWQEATCQGGNIILQKAKL